MATLNKESIAELDRLAAAATKDPLHQLPNATINVVNRKGELIYSKYAGKVGVTSDKDVTSENIFWISSCAKMASMIIILQTVEKGLIGLDSADDVDKYAPELANIPILKQVNPDGTLLLVPKTKRITLRMLLNHTAGFGYTIFNEGIKKYSELFGGPEFVSNYSCYEKFPLLFEPGEQFNYSSGIDWAMNIVARAEGKSFDQLLQERLVKPLGLHSVTAAPDRELQKKLVDIQLRMDGKFVPIPYPVEWTLSDNEYKRTHAYQSAGAGIFTQPGEYTKIMSVLLNKGVYEPTGARILSEETVKSMFVNQIPQWPDIGRDGFKTTLPIVVKEVDEIFPQPGRPPQGWGFACFLNLVPVEGGRAVNSGAWCGVSNSYLIVDPTSGISVFIASEYFPFNDEQGLKFAYDIEQTVYKGLNKE